MLETGTREYVYLGQVHGEIRVAEYRPHPGCSGSVFA
jgi:hypothetical protein